MQMKYRSLPNCKKHRENAAFGLHLVLNLSLGVAAVRCSFVWPSFICWFFTLDFRQRFFWGLGVQLWCPRGMWSFLILWRFVMSSLGIASKEAEVWNNSHIEQRDRMDGEMGWQVRQVVCTGWIEGRIPHCCPKLWRERGFRGEAGRVFLPRPTPWLGSAALTQADVFDVGEPSCRNGDLA